MYWIGVFVSWQPLSVIKIGLNPAKTDVVLKAIYLHWGENIKFKFTVAIEGIL